MILAWAGHAAPDIVADFEREHGVKVRAKYYTGGDNMLGLISQSPPGTFDLILSDAEYVQQLNAADYIERLDLADYPFDDFYPEFQHFPGHWQGDELYSVMVRFGFLGIAFNTQLLPESKAKSYQCSGTIASRARSATSTGTCQTWARSVCSMATGCPTTSTRRTGRGSGDKTMSLRGQVAGFFDYGGTFSSLKTARSTRCVALATGLPGSCSVPGHR